MPFLIKVQFTLPASNNAFIKQFIDFMSSKGNITKNGIVLRTSHEDFFPKTMFMFEGDKHPFTSFMLDDESVIKVTIANTTPITKNSPYDYSHISLKEFIKRMQSFSFLGLDHTGFNLPYFNGVHPQILELREKLKNACLYHTFPKHIEDAPWDFIIPGTKEEVERIVSVDYQQIRKPKFEIVSFENSSIPLIQIDIQVQGKYEDLVQVFPESLQVPQLRNMWVYIKNDFDIDICFVLNEVSESNWSYQFAKERLG